MATQTTPYGSWRSPLDSERVVAGTRTLSLPRFDRGTLYWLEGRPDDGGRQVVVRQRGRGVEDVSPAGVNVRARVHEYGGGDYSVRDGVLFFVDFEKPGIFRLDARGVRPFGACEPGALYADFEVSPDGRWLLSVEEHPASGREPANRIVAFDSQGGRRRVVEARFDFATSPRFSPDGSWLAYTTWSHPQMPWDGTELWLLPWSDGGPAGRPRRVAGGPQESIVQHGFSPAGHLSFVSDRSGWWNLHQLREGRARPLCRREAEFGLPPWGLAQSTFGFVSEDLLLCAYGSAMQWRVAWLELGTGRLQDLDLPYTTIRGLQVAGEEACFVAGSPARPEAVCRLSLRGGSLEEVRASADHALDEGLIARPEAIEIPSDGHRTYGFLYRPRNPRHAAPRGTLPPLLVKSHGGPTGATAPLLQLPIQYWTSRGFAVLDVNYRGSTGYGRAYRELLRGQWGVADVADCVSAALHLVREGLVDSQRLTITGGSAGGYTTLCALTFHDVFHAGASRYGIGDLEALARDTHKFESRYLEGLIGPYPEARALYRERSPIHYTERLSCPVVFFQGLEDRVVPPAQAEAMVEALARAGIPHAYVAFPAEQHGFRRSENIRMALDGELYFYAQVFGFDVEARPEAVKIRRVSTGRTAPESGPGA